MIHLLPLLASTKTPSSQPWQICRGPDADVCLVVLSPWAYWLVDLEDYSGLFGMRRYSADYRNKTLSTNLATTLTWNLPWLQDLLAQEGHISCGSAELMFNLRNLLISKKIVFSSTFCNFQVHNSLKCFLYLFLSIWFLIIFVSYIVLDLFIWDRVSKCSHS